MAVGRVAHAVPAMSATAHGPATHAISSTAKRDVALAGVSNGLASGGPDAAGTKAGAFGRSERQTLRQETQTHSW